MSTTRKTLNPEQQERLRQYVATMGSVRAASSLRVSPQTVASLAAGFPVHTAIIEMVERRLVELTEVSRG